MSSFPDQIKEELLHIEIAVELDQGKSTNEVAEKFGIKLLVVKTIAKIIAADQPQTKTVKSRRFSEAEREVLVGRIEAGETVEDLGAEAGVTENTLLFRSLNKSVLLNSGKLGNCWKNRFGRILLKLITLAVMQLKN